MDNLTEELQGTANPAEAEKSDCVAADLGKFKDVKALLNAYASLEAEFTRRSQRLKELEEKNTEPLPAEQSAPSSAENDARSLYEQASGDEAVKTAIIADYLKAVQSGRGAPVVAGGIFVPSPKNKPVSIREAGRLAKEFLNNN